MYLNFKMMPVFSSEEIRNAYNSQCKEEEQIEDLANLFWPENFCNNSYKRLWLAKSQFDEDLEENVRTFLRESFPEYESILVDVSW